jgi:hypothetical protein
MSPPGGISGEPTEFNELLKESSPPATPRQDRHPRAALDYFHNAE